MPKLLAFDSNFLYGLAAGADSSLTVLEMLRERHFELLIPPTVVQELSSKASDVWAEPKVRALALLALRGLRGWQIAPFDLVSVGHGITEEFGKCLRNRQLLPLEEVNDGLIVAEVALYGIPVLVTSDPHLLDIDAVELKAVLDEKDLAQLVICHPKEVRKLLGGR